MREIKFRVWDHNTDTMMVPDNFEFYDGKIGWIDASREAGPKLGNDGDPDQFEIMQYTGLHDKNGREIYEGDIVKNEYGDVVVVQYGTQDHEEDYGDRFVYQGWNIQIGSGYPDAVMIEHTVIGNIYENPELLEARNDD